jgi:transcriptional regulator with XRE-family HTH domain
MIIGEYIKQKVKEQNLSVSEFASLISCTRTNVYSIFKRKKIDYVLLQRISKVLNCNFTVSVSPEKEDVKQYLTIAYFSEEDLNDFIKTHTPELCWALS